MTATLSRAVTQDQRDAESAGGAKDAAVSQIVSFRLANEEYGLDIMKVQEIILMGEITEIPEVSDFIRGLINLRGKVIPIVDLRKRFGLDTGDLTEHTRIIVVDTTDATFGIIVDAVNKVLRIDEKQMEPPPTGLLGAEQAYIMGLVKMEEKIMILLNLDRILSVQDHDRLSGSLETQT